MWQAESLGGTTVLTCHTWHRQVLWIDSFIVYNFVWCNIADPAYFFECFRSSLLVGLSHPAINESTAAVNFVMNYEYELVSMGHLWFIFNPNHV